MGGTITTPMVDHHPRLLASGLDLSVIPRPQRYRESDTLRAALSAGEVEIVLWCLQTPVRLSQGEWDRCTEALLSLRLPVAAELWTMWQTVWPDETAHLLGTSQVHHWLCEGHLAPLCYPNQKDFCRLWPYLAWYAGGGQLETVRWLVGRGPADSVAQRQPHLLLEACGSGRLEMVLYIQSLTATPPVYETPHLLRALRGGGTTESRLQLLRYLHPQVSGEIDPRPLQRLALTGRCAELEWCVTEGWLAEHPLPAVDPVYLETVDARMATGGVSSAEAARLLQVGDWPRFRSWWERDPSWARGQLKSNEVPLEECVQPVYDRGGAEWLCGLVSWWHEYGMDPGQMIGSLRACEDWAVHDHLLRLLPPEIVRVGERWDAYLTPTSSPSRIYWIGEQARQHGWQWRYRYGTPEARHPGLGQLERDRVRVRCRLDAHQHALYQAWGLWTPDSDPAPPVSHADRVRPVDDPYHYEECLSGLSPGEVPEVPVSVRSLLLYLGYCRRRGLPSAPDLADTVAGSVHYRNTLTAEEKTGLWQLLLQTSSRSPLEVMIAAGTIFSDVVRVCRRLGCLPEVTDLLSTPIFQHRLLGKSGRWWRRSLRRTYPGLRLFQVGSAICCEVEGPLQGWESEPPIWWIGKELDLAQAEARWRRYQGPKSARS